MKTALTDNDEPGAWCIGCLPTGIATSDASCLVYDVYDDGGLVAGLGHMKRRQRKWRLQGPLITKDPPLAYTYDLELVEWWPQCDSERFKRICLFPTPWVHHQVAVDMMALESLNIRTTCYCGFTVTQESDPVKTAAALKAFSEFLTQRLLLSLDPAISSAIMGAV